MRLLAAALVGAIGFGFWQASVGAALWMFIVLLGSLCATEAYEDAVDCYLGRERGGKDGHHG